jgi:hypothetical protein
MPLAVITEFEQFPLVFTADDWLEAVALYSQSTSNITTRKSYCTMTGYIPFSKLRAAILYFVGYSFVDSDNLARVVPAYHPIYDYMWATTIVEATAIHFTGKLDSPYDPPGLAYADYTYCRLTVAYEPLPWGIQWDVFVNDYAPFPHPEYQRYVQYSMKPNSQIFTYDNGAFYFFAPGESFDQAQISAPQTRIVMKKTNIFMTWYQVPEDFILDSAGTPSRLLAMDKTVNANDFSFIKDATGYTWQTLFCEDIDLGERYTMPLVSLIQEREMYFYDIKFTLTHFSPESAVPDELNQFECFGHNLVPAFNGKYYPAVNSSESLPDDERRLFKLYDWNLAFQYAGGD